MYTFGDKSLGIRYLLVTKNKIIRVKHANHVVNKYEERTMNKIHYYNIKLYSAEIVLWINDPIIPT